MSVQYYTVVDWDASLRDVETTDTDTIGEAYAGLVQFAIKVTTGAPAATAKKFMRAAIIQNAFDGTTYQNTGTTASPTWSLIDTAGAGGITQLTGDVTAGPGNGSVVASIAAGVIVDADVNASAAIAYSKLAPLSSGNILVGSAGNVATSVNPTGDVDITNAGLFTVTDLTITGEAAGDILYFNGTNWVKLAIGTAGQVLTVNAGATAPEWQTP